MDGERGGRGGAGLLVLQAPARRPGDDGGGRGRVHALTVRVLVERRVPGLRLVLAHHEPGQRQVLDCGDGETQGLEDTSEIMENYVNRPNTDGFIYWTYFYFIILNMSPSTYLLLD